MTFGDKANGPAQVYVTRHSDLLLVLFPAFRGRHLNGAKRWNN